MREILVLEHAERLLELAGEMRSATREILKRIYEYEELSGISFLDQKNMLLDFMCDLSDQQYDLGVELEKRAQGLPVSREDI